MVVPQTLGAPSEDGHYIIPKGHTAVASPAFTQVDKRIWHNTDKWDPYRWADPNGEAAKALQEYLGGGDKVDYGYGIVSKGTDSVYQPFGAGRHRCIGEHVSICYLNRRSALLIRGYSLPTSKLVPSLPPSLGTSRCSWMRSPRVITV